jgi:hypothetical protein
MNLSTLMLQAHLTIAPGFGPDVQRNYLHGMLDIRPDERVSLRSDAFLFVGTQGGPGDLLHNHSVFMGPVVHFQAGKVDPYVGFQPGLGLVQSQWKVDGVARQSERLVTPLVSGLSGIQVRVHPLFHFFGEGRYVSGRHLSADPTAHNLDEVRVSFGLGFGLGG